MVRGGASLESVPITELDGMAKNHGFDRNRTPIALAQHTFCPFNIVCIFMLTS